MKFVRTCLYWAAGLVVLLAGVDARAAEDWREGLGDRELAIQRWFSSLTFMADRAAPEWPVWYRDGKEFATSSLRYQLAFGSYGLVALAEKTPAYRDLLQRQLHDMCERMIDRRVWSYSTHYWDYGDGAPDPCLYENVMYTGHVAHMMGLYELMTGDMRYSESGWDFEWSDGRKVHYTLEKAIQRMHVQSEKHENGGICCEPGLVFADCNSHSSIAYLLHDLLHGTRYAAVNQKWFDWMSREFRNKIPLSTEFLYVIHQQETGTFIPVGDVGGDAWALGWGYSWFPTTDFAKEGWEHTLAKADWQHPAEDQTYAVNNFLVRKFAGGSVNAANAFVTLLGMQIEGPESDTAGRILNWMEREHGTWADTDDDGHDESYYYDTSEQYRIPATGTLLAAQALEDGDALRRLLRTRRDALRAEPTLSAVEYPKVMVRSAEYRAPTLRFAIVPGSPSTSGETKLRCTNLPAGVRVLRNGKPYSGFVQDGDELVITTSAGSEQVFEVKHPAKT